MIVGEPTIAAPLPAEGNEPEVATLLLLVPVAAAALEVATIDDPPFEVALEVAVSTAAAAAFVLEVAMVVVAAATAGGFPGNTSGTTAPLAAVEELITVRGVDETTGELAVVVLLTACRLPRVIWLS